MSAPEPRPSPHVALLPHAAESLASLSSVVGDRVDEWFAARDPDKFVAMELAVHQVFREAADGLVGALLTAMTNDDELRVEARRRARERRGRRLRNGGAKKVKVTLLGGKQVEVRADYMKLDRRAQAGSKKSKKARGRGRGGTGLYPLLAALGIFKGVTPALAAEICRQVADSDSVRAGRAALDRRAIDLGHKQTLRIVNAVGQRLVRQRDAWLKEMSRTDQTALNDGPLKNKRVVIATDGGRIRTRKVKRGRRRKETGHHRYDAVWREPKLFAIYVVDDDGEMDPKFRPIYDATLGDCQATFEKLTAYLRALGAHQARELIVLGDGAHWIWNRTEALATAIGLPYHRFVEVVDWYHAVEHLTEVAAIPKWSEPTKQAWLSRAKDRLFAGDTDGLMGLFDEIAAGRRAEAVNKGRGYFLDNAERMTYSDFRDAKIPLGSGAVESAIRRVINMRLKANGSFWLEKNAEAMLLLRCYLKSGRFDDLMRWSNDRAAKWWTGGAWLAPIAEIAVRSEARG